MGFHLVGFHGIVNDNLLTHLGVIWLDRGNPDCQVALPSSMRHEMLKDGIETA